MLGRTLTMLAVDALEVETVAIHPHADSDKTRFPIAHPMLEGIFHKRDEQQWREPPVGQ